MFLKAVEENHVGQTQGIRNYSTSQGKIKYIIIIIIIASINVFNYVLVARMWVREAAAVVVLLAILGAL